MVITVKITPAAQTETYCILPAGIRLMDLPKNPGKTRLHYGTRSLIVEVKKSPENSLPANDFFVTKALAQKLLLNDNQKLSIKVNPEGEVELGPLVGYFISDDKLKSLKSGVFDLVYAAFLNSAKALGGEAFLFSVNDINRSRSLIVGYSYNSEYPAKLRKSQYPIPRVIYNRCFSSTCIQQIKQFLSGIDTDIILTSPGQLRSRSDIPPRGAVTQPAKVMGCPIQVRILTQRDYSGTWRYSSGVIRLNTPGHPKPWKYLNSYPLKNGLMDAFPADYVRIESALIKQAVEESEKLGRNVPALVEMEIRLEVNQKGQGTINRVYEKPLKKFTAKFRGSSAAYLSATRPLHYCFKLAGFPLKDEPAIPPQGTKNDNRPLIGIFEELWEMDDLKAQKAPRYQLLLARASAELGCITYHFSLNELKGINCIKGWYYDHSKQKWLQKEFPWPQVFYDRSTFPYASQRQKAKDFRRDLKRYGKTIFLNTKSVFGKGYTSDVLEKMPCLSKYLPRNVINPSRSMVQELLNSYRSVFIKTEHGSNLRGVLKIARKNQTYLMSGRYENTSFSNFDGLWSKISDLVGTEPFVAQEGITAALYQYQPLNVRTITQKNGEGIWEVPLVKPWIASTPEVRGFPTQWTKTVVDVFGSPEKAADLYEEITELSLCVAKTLEAQTGYLGELGIDLILDPSGHPWIIEVNGKTNKIFFLKDEKPGSYYELYYNPIAYACFLSRNYSIKV